MFARTRFDVFCRDAAKLATAPPSATLNVTQKDELNRADILLVALVTVSWGLTYPVTKFGIRDFPPLTFRALSLIIGIVFLAAFMIFRGQGIGLIRREIYPVFRSGFFNIALWQIGMVYGVLYLNSGRAAILGYTMPVWAFLASILFYRATPTWRGSIGVVLALSAIVMLAMNDWQSFLNSPVGFLAIIGGAISWGIGTAMVRNTPLKASNESLTLWSLICGFLVMATLACLFEADRWRIPNFGETLAILYGGVFSFTLCYVIWFQLTRRLPPVVSSLSIMMVPVIGVMSSVVTLGEQLTVLDVLALLLILTAMAVVLLPARLWKSKRLGRGPY